MLPAPIRPLLRPRYFTWLLFLGLFVWAVRFYRNHPKSAVKKLHKADLYGTDPFVMVGGFKIGREWIDIPDGINLPPGLDIELDMQTGRKRVRLHEPGAGSRNGVVPVGSIKDVACDENEEISPLPQRKWQRIYDSQHKTVIDEALDALATNNEAKISEALEYLETHSGTIDVGAGLVRSPYFPNLLYSLTQEKSRPQRRLSAAEIIFACLQNNPIAVEGILETTAVKDFILHLNWEEDGIIIRRVLSSLIAILRGDKSGRCLAEFAKQQTVLTLSHLSTKKLHDQQIIDRILVLLVGLVESQNGSYVERSASVNLLENILKNVPKPYSDWMLHAFRPFCLSKPDILSRKPALTAFCVELNANPNDTSML
jgi:hypothetical protein